MERSEAMKLLLPKYNTGRSCKKGHFSDRYTVSGACMGCISSNSRDFYKNVRLLKDNLDLKTCTVSVNVTRNDLPTLKIILDSYCTEYHPDLSNPYPFKKTKLLDVTSDVLNVQVRVPHNKAQEIINMSNTLLAMSLPNLKEPDLPKQPDRQCPIGDEKCL